jgi:hypothetical protein
MRGIEGKWDTQCFYTRHRDAWDLFETHEAAEKAARIMNRDGWEVPAL